MRVDAGQRGEAYGPTGLSGGRAGQRGHYEYRGTAAPSCYGMFREG